MRKVKLTLLSLIALGAMSLASCTGAQGEKGDKGDQGEQGPQGNPGENGEDGEDGSLWYTGEGVPSSDLGKEGDMYLDTSTNDIYQKEASGWVLKTNIQGDPGEDGEDGENGRPGSNGSDGETAWSNTILPTSGGVVYPSLGSAIEGSEITFIIDPSETMGLDTFTLNGEEIDYNSPNFVFNEDALTYSYTTTMVKNGFVVSASFVALTTASGNTYIDGQPFTGSVVDRFGNVFNRGTLSDGPTFADGTGTESDPLVINEETTFSSETLTSSGKSYFKLNADISIDENNSTIPAVRTEDEDVTNIDLNGRTLTLDSADNTPVDAGDRLVISNGNLDLRLNETNLDGGAGSTIIPQRGSTLILNDVNLISNGTGIYPRGDATRVELNNTVVNAFAYALGTNAGEPANYNVVIEVNNSQLYASAGSAVLINVPSDVSISNSIIGSPWTPLIVRGGTVEVSNSTLYVDALNEYTNNQEAFYEGNWSGGNGVPLAAITVGDRSSSENSYAYETDLTLSNNIVIDGIAPNSDATLESNLLTESDNETNNESSPTEAYLFYAYGKNEEHPTIVRVDTATYEEFEDRVYIRDQYTQVIVDDHVVSGTNAFYNGQLYSKLILNNDGTVNEEKSTPVDGIKFDGGTGLSENSALEISTDAQLLSIFNNDILNKLDVYYVLTEDVSLSGISEGIPFYGHLDLNGHSITRNDNSFINGLHGSIKNGIILLGESRTQVEALIYIAESGAVLEDITIGTEADREGGFITFVNNGAVLVSYLRSGIADDQFTLRNIVNNYNIDYGSSGYGSPILGGYAATTAEHNAIVNFEGCINYGDIRGRDVSAFVGNASCEQSTYAQYIFNNCANYGEIVGYNGANSYIACPNTNSERYQEVLSSNVSLGSNNNCDNSLVSTLTLVDFSSNLSYEAGTDNNLVIKTLDNVTLPQGAATFDITLSTYLRAYDGETPINATLLSKLQSTRYNASELTATGLTTDLYVAGLNQEVKVDDTITDNNGTRWVYENGSYVIYHVNGEFDNGESDTRDLVLKATSNISLMVTFYNDSGEVIAISSSVRLNIGN